MVLFCVPAAVPVTLMVNVHVLLAAIDPPARLTLLLPATAVGVAPHVFPVRPLGVETTSPPGNVSPNPTPVSVVVVLLF